MDYKYVCDVSPEHLFYNIMYHIKHEEHTEETLEKAIRNIIFGSSEPLHPKEVKLLAQ